MRPTLAAALLVLGALAPLAGAQDVTTDPSGDYILQFDETEGERIADFIDLAKHILGKPIKYVPQELADKRIHIAGPIRVKREDFFDFFQAVLRAYDYIVHPYGPPDSQFLSVQLITQTGARGSAGGGFVKAQAPIVPVSELHRYAQAPATLITTSIPLRYVDARGAMATFQPFFDSTIEQVRNVENSNALVITGFGSNVWGAWQLVGLVDVPPFQPQPHIVKRILENASVDEVEPVLTDLLAAARGLRAGQTAAPQVAPGAAVREIEPRIIPDPRSNAFLVAGEPEMVERIEGWIDILDVEVEPRGFTHVVRMQNTDAGQLEQVLNQVLTEEEAGQQQARAGGAATAAASSLEIRPSVVADATSNSLIITASDRKYAEIVEMLRNLDVRRRQVLVEAAIVETSKTLNDVFAAGIAVADFDDGGFVSNFGTPLGIGEDGEVDLAGTLGSIGSGGSLALFSSQDVPIPLFLQWLASQTDTRVLSRPSLLTNDNEEAELAAETETAYRVSTTGANSVTTESFETVTAGIRLGISPTISAGNYLRLLVRLEVSDFSPSSSGLVGAPPDITTREVETPVTVPDGHTIVLGGLVSRITRKQESKIPWLGDLPLIGWLFRATSDSNEDRYLYVFLTSHIIDTDFALLDEISAARQQDYERLGGDVRDLAGSISVPGPPGAIDPLEGLQSVFAMPTVALPPAAEAPPGGASPNGGRRQGAAQDDEFDAVFGFPGDTR